MTICPLVLGFSISFVCKKSHLVDGGGWIHHTAETWVCATQDVCGAEDCKMQHSRMEEKDGSVWAVSQVSK